VLWTCGKTWHARDKVESKITHTQLTIPPKLYFGSSFLHRITIEACSAAQATVVPKPGFHTCDHATQASASTDTERSPCATYVALDLARH